MGVLRALIAIIVTVVVVVFILQSFPSTRNVISTFTDTVPIEFPDFFKSEKVTGNITFSLHSNAYIKNISSDVDGVDVSFRSQEMTLTTGTGGIDGERFVTITGYSGTLILDENNLQLDGGFEKLELPELGIFFSGDDITADITFDDLTIFDFYLDELRLRGISGSLDVRNLEIALTDEDVIIENSQAKYVLKDGETDIEGKAKSVFLPDAEIKIE